MQQFSNLRHTEKSDYYHFSHDTVYDRAQMFKVILQLFLTYKIIKASHG